MKRKTLQFDWKIEKKKLWKKMKENIGIRFKQKIKNIENQWKIIKILGISREAKKIQNFNKIDWNSQKKSPDFVRKIHGNPDILNIFASIFKISGFHEFSGFIPRIS